MSENRGLPDALSCNKPVKIARGELKTSAKKPKHSASVGKRKSKSSGGNKKRKVSPVVNRVKSGKVQQKRQKTVVRISRKKKAPTRNFAVRL